MITIKEEINYLVSVTLLEIRSNFRWNEFKKIETPEERLDYLEKTGTKLLGRGSSRAAYLLSNRYVLKVALPNNKHHTANVAGKAQNEEEVSLTTDPTTKPVLAQVYDMASDYSWIVSEAVRGLRDEGEFEQLTGLPFETMTDILDLVFDGVYEEQLEINQKNLDHRQRMVDALEAEISIMDPDDPSLKYYQSDLDHELIEKKWALEEMQKLQKAKHPLVKALIDLIKNKGAMSGDIGKIEHWGKTADGKIVLLDYGYSRNVAREQYGVSWV